MVEVEAMVRFVPAANVPLFKKISPPFAMVLPALSVTVPPVLFIVKLPVRLLGKPVPVFCAPEPL